MLVIIMNWSALAKFRCGVTSMIIETGRFERLVYKMETFTSYMYGPVINTYSTVL